MAFGVFWGITKFSREQVERLQSVPWEVGEAAFNFRLPPLSESVNYVFAVSESYQQPFRLSRKNIALAPLHASGVDYPPEHSESVVVVGRGPLLSPNQARVPETPQAAVRVLRRPNPEGRREGQIVGRRRGRRDGGQHTRHGGLQGTAGEDWMSDREMQDELFMCEW
jgi:hypothetical protein